MRSYHLSMGRSNNVAVRGSRLCRDHSVRSLNVLIVHWYTVRVYIANCLCALYQLVSAEDRLTHC